MKERQGQVALPFFILSLIDDCDLLSNVKFDFTAFRKKGIKKGWLAHNTKMKPG
jgi:adenine-specific DNA methylase